MTVYDCAINPHNIKIWDLGEVGSCKNPEKQFRDAKEMIVQVIKNEELQTQKIYKCQIFRTLTATPCGFDSLTYPSFEIETMAPVRISSEDCRRLVKSKKISMYQQDWKIETLQHFSFDADVIGEFLFIFLNSC